jgi:hypothetical protein
MKLRLPSCFTLLVCFLSSVAHADPIFPLPEYFIAATPGGPVTDIPGALISQVGPNSWDINPPAGQSFILAPALVPQMVLRDPDDPGSFTIIQCSNVENVPVRWASVKADPLNPPSHPWWTPLDRGLLTLQSGNVPVGTVWLLDPPDAIPDSSSTLCLLAAALLCIAGFARCRRASA